MMERARGEGSGEEPLIDLQIWIWKSGDDPLPNRLIARGQLEMAYMDAWSPESICMVFDG